MKKFLFGLVAVVLLLSPQRMAAQIDIPDTIPGKGFFISQLNLAKHIMDFFVDKRDASNAEKLDSNYIGYYPEKLLFSSGLAQSGGWLSIQDEDSSFKLGSDVSRALSLRACYRGLAMVFALNPFNMFGNTDSEFDISFYGDKLVLDFVYQNSNSMSGTYSGVYSPTNEVVEETAYSLDDGIINRRLLSFGTMYVFNSRRFSYAAAFDQTCIQKRSCGSILLGANYLYNRLRIDLDFLGNVYMRSKMFGIGGGYGYNFVLPKRWLVSASALAEFGVWTRNYFEMSPDFAAYMIGSYFEEGKEIPADFQLEDTYTYDNIPIILIPRLAVVHHFGRFFAGFTGLGTFHYEKNDGLSNYNFVFTSNLLFGLRL